MKSLSLNNQTGAVLAVGLIMLLLMTVVGLAGTRVTGLEEKMASNSRDRNLSFQAAETALLAGEAAASNVSQTAACGTYPVGFYPLQDFDCNGTQDTSQIWESVDWTSAVQTVAYNGGALASVNSLPRYIVEDMGVNACKVVETPCQTSNQLHSYRITARATGGTNNAVVMLQTIFQP
ncbi:MAG: PilX N-terminal domain-containing pilus assembly protein [Methylococcaceae bacterium]|jgi:type IV pilus assembly protein PilX